MCGAALYWVPLFQLLMGARPGELVQAQVGDVVTEDGTTLLSITDEGEEHDEDEEIPLHAKRVKTEAARRKVPIHPELLRLGFLDYLRDRRADVGLGGELFAGLHKTAREEARSYFSDAFRDLTRELAIYKPMLTKSDAEHLLRENADGNLVLGASVLNEFKGISADAVWVRPDRYWRWRVDEDEPGRDQRG